MNIRIATGDDISGIMEIIKATLAIFRSENNPQWDELYPAADVFEADIRNGSLYVYGSESIEGFVCIDGNQPTEYEGVNWSSDSPALCVHRLAVHPQTRGNGVGGKLMKHAETVALTHGVYNLRTDTFSENTKMNALFAKQGFFKVGEIEFRGLERPFYCYDKLLTKTSLREG